MPLPTLPLADDKANETLQLDDHPAHHNELADAINWALNPISAFIDPRNHGALLDGLSDDAVAVRAAYAAAPAGSILFIAGGTWTFLSEVPLNRPDVEVWVTAGTTVDCTALAGVGTVGIHDTRPVIAAFHVTAPRVTVRIDGDIYCAATDTSIAGVNLVGVLVNGAARTAIKGSGRIRSTCTNVNSGFYSAIWAGGGATDLLVDGIEVDTAFRNVLMGWPGQAGVMVRRWTLRDVNSHGALNDGLKLTSSVLEGRIIGGQYHHNGADGLDGYVGGEQFDAIGVLFCDNGNHGAECKISSPNSSNVSPGETGVHGANRRFTFSHCRFLRNAIEGIAVDVSLRTDAGPPSVTEENYPFGPEVVRVVECEIAYNCAAGGRFNVGPGSGVIGGSVHHNGLGGGPLNQPAGSGGLRFESCKDVECSGVAVFDNCGVGVDWASKATLSTDVPNRDFTAHHIHARNTQPPRTITDAAMTVRDVGAGAMTSGSAVLTTSRNGQWDALLDLYAVVTVPLAGPAGADLVTTVAGVTDIGTVTLADAASATVSGKTIHVRRAVLFSELAEFRYVEDANSTVVVTGAGIAAANLSTPITRVLNPRMALLATAASTSVSAAVATIGTADRSPRSTSADAAMSAASAHAISPSANLDAVLDVGAFVTVPGAGVLLGAPATLGAYILTVVSATEAILSTPASYAVSGVVMTVDRRPQSYNFALEQIVYSDVSNNTGRNGRSSDWLVAGYPITSDTTPRGLDPLAANRVIFLGNRGRGQPANLDMVVETPHHYQPHSFGQADVPARAADGTPGQITEDIDLPGVGGNTDALVVTANGAYPPALRLDGQVSGQDKVTLRLSNFTTSPVPWSTYGTRYIHVSILRYAVPT